MADALQSLLPIFLFMLIPVWIPVFTVTVGAIVDSLRGGRGRTSPHSARIKR